MIISKLQAYVKITQTRGRIFSAQFVKKDGTLRNINCRTGATKGLKGVGMKYEAIDKLLVTVYDVKKKAYRMINLNTLRKLNVNKMKYMVL
ncbi:MAG: SH3 beta-barrel fold-containing protein [Candidatus Nezhaarchaeales archaeon]